MQSNLYVYDALGNMQRRVDFINRVDESFTYDNLNRLTGASWTPGASLTAPAGFTAKTYRYDAIGNITYKSDVGAYSYHPYHPHAVQTAGGNSYIYDTHGNMVRGAGRTLHWTSFNKPSGIWTATGYTGFAYDAGHNRISKTTPTTETHYIGKLFERQVMNGITKDVNYIYAGSRLVSQVEEVSGITTVKYIHSDHLGSISMITDAGGAVLERLSFDVFGKPRNANGTDAATPITSSQATRGYTGHEMDAFTGLINMNARLYDPVLGRFISADSIIPAPGNMQAFNRYSYVDNNPLKYTDPSGHFKLGNLWKAIKPFVAIAVAFALQQYYLIPELGMGSFAAGVIAGAAGGGVSGGWKGAVYGAIAGGAFGFIHGLPVDAGARAMLHGAVGAGMSGMRGGDVGIGFLSAAIPGVFAGTIDGIGGGDQFGVFSRSVASGVIGGVVSAIGGQGFLSGFQTAAFARLLNDENKTWKRQRTIVDGERYSFKAGRTIRVEVGTGTLGMDRVRFETDARPLGKDGKLSPVIQNETRPYYVASPVTGGASTFIFDAGFNNSNGWEWTVSIPMQPATKDNSGGHWLTVSTYE